MCVLTLNPIAPMGFSHVLRLCLQGGGVSINSGTVSFSSCTITGNTATGYNGGGVYVYSGTVTMTSCSITGNTAGGVRAHVHNFPLPQWENADALALTLACTTANDASVNCRGCVPQRPRKFPSPRWDISHFLRLCLQGGGVRIDGGSVAFSSCTITGNTASSVRAHAQNFPSPRWENG